MTNDLLCPSAPLYKGSKLLGVVNSENKIDILEDPIEIDEVFVEVANKGKAAEQKFRFVNKCIKNGCKQWTGNNCGVIQRVLNTIEERIMENEMPECSIRPECRWFNQEGYNACKACTLIKYI